MDKTIMIDGKPVVFRKTAGTARRYQMQFQREFLDDLQKLADMQAQLAPDAPKETKARAVMGLETAWMYDIAFIMAQQADPSIRDELEWLDRFESIDIYAVIGELIPMLVAEGRPSPKNA